MHDLATEPYGTLDTVMGRIAPHTSWLYRLRAERAGTGVRKGARIEYSLKSHSSRVRCQGVAAKLAHDPFSAGLIYVYQEYVSDFVQTGHIFLLFIF